jgi:hypothetical protein
MRSVFYAATAGIVGLIAAVALADPSFAGAREEALHAMEKMSFQAKLGDHATVTARMTTVRRGVKDPFEMRYAYVVSEILAGGGSDLNTAYIVDLTFLYAGKPGKPSPPGFEEVMRKILPPLQVRLDKDFRPVAVLNWADVRRSQKRGMKVFKTYNVVMQKLALPMLMLVSSQELVLEMMKPIASMQRKKWFSENGSFERAISKAGSLAITGKQMLTPVAVSGDTLRASMVTTYETEELNRKMNASVLGKLANKKRREQGLPETAFNMTIEAKGEAVFNLRTGWLEKTHEVLTIKNPGATKLTVINELEQVRD